MMPASSEITRLVRSHAQAGFSPSGIVAVARKGELLQQETWGADGYDLDSPFRVASLTKSFTALALLILRRSGRLGLDDAVKTHIPELRTVAKSGWPELRLRHLLGMTAGLATDNPWGDRQESISREQLTTWAAQGLRLLFAPGTDFEYSNLGYALLGEVITRVSGQEYRDFVREQILDPLSLTGTRFSAKELPGSVTGYHREPLLAGEPASWSRQEPSGPGSFSSIGGLYSTINDLLRWTALFQKFEIPAGAAFTKADLIEAQEPLGPVTAGLAGAPLHGAVASGYGFGLAVDNYANYGKVVGHSGGYPGFTANMSWHVRSGLTVVVSTNGTHSAATMLATKVLAQLLLAEPGSDAAVEPWRETVEAVAVLSELVTRAVETSAADWSGLFAENVEPDFPLERRLQFLRQGLESLGAVGPAEADANYGRPSSARWTLPAEFGAIELYLELMPVAPYAVQTFSAAIIRGAGRTRLF